MNTASIAQAIGSRPANVRRTLADLERAGLIVSINGVYMLNEPTTQPQEPPEPPRPSLKRTAKKLTAREGLALMEEHKQLNRDFIRVTDDLRRLSGALMKNKLALIDFERRIGASHGV